VGECLTATTPLDFGATPRVPPGVAPRLGEHTTAVLQALNAGNDNQATDR
jgi:crotonobetainyl-CoA:carnitine CoA-transferase CaiB-like acyl-CoA transferase